MEIKKDSDKLRILADWFDVESSFRENWSASNEVQEDLRRIAQELEVKTVDSILEVTKDEFETLSNALKVAYEDCQNYLSDINSDKNIRKSIEKQVKSIEALCKKLDVKLT